MTNKILYYNIIQKGGKNMKKISFNATEDIPEMIKEFQKWMKKENGCNLDTSKTIRTMIFQRWAQLPEEYHNIYKSNK